MATPVPKIDESGARPVAPAVLYDDEIVKQFLWATVIWGVVGMLLTIAALGAMVGGFIHSRAPRS